VKRAGTPFVILLLLAATACGKPGAAGGNGADDDAVITADGGRPSVEHDPRAMTAIDVATGDLSGFAHYAGGRAWAPQPNRAASSGEPAVPAQETTNAVAAVPGDAGPSAIPLVVPPPTTENSAAPATSSGQTPP
jgi:hypothetical protein